MGFDISAGSIYSVVSEIFLSSSFPVYASLYFSQGSILAITLRYIFQCYLYILVQNSFSLRYGNFNFVLPKEKRRKERREKTNILSIVIPNCVIVHAHAFLPFSAFYTKNKRVTTIKTFVAIYRIVYVNRSQRIQWD